MAKKVSTPEKSDPPFKKVNGLLDKLSSLKKLKSSKKLYIVLIIAGLLALGVYKKELFIAATVNGAPVTNLDLQMRLNKEFRTQILNSIINEKIILDEAAKNNAIPSEIEVNQKISEIETNVGGAQALDALLSQQKQTRQSIRQQIKLQLTIEKLYTKDATVSAEELTAFIESNKEQLRATDSAGQATEASEILKQQKLSQLFSQKFQELRGKAKIKIF